LRNSDRNIFPTLFLFGKRGPTDFASGFAHGFLPFLGTGVCRNAFTASSNLMPLRFGIIVFASFFFSLAGFDFDTDSLSAPWNVRGFWFNKAIAFLI
jgi:hypothetical protein